MKYINLPKDSKKRKKMLKFIDQIADDGHDILKINGCLIHVKSRMTDQVWIYNPITGNLKFPESSEWINLKK